MAVASSPQSVKERHDSAELAALEKLNSYTNRAPLECLGVIYVRGDNKHLLCLQVTHAIRYLPSILLLKAASPVHDSPRARHSPCSTTT